MHMFDLFTASEYHCRRFEAFVGRHRRMVFFLVVLALVAFFMLPAHASEASTVNLSPLVDKGFELLSAALVALLTGVVGLLAKKLHLDSITADAAMNTMLHDGIQRGLDTFEGMVRDRVYKDGKPVTIDVRSEAVAFVANRLIALSPALIKRLGLTGDRLEAIVDQALSARGIAGVALPPAASSGVAG